MRRLLLVLALAAGLLPAAVSATPSAPQEVRNGGVRAVIGDTEIRLGNALVERVWTRAPFGTASVTDRRDGGLPAGPSRDFRLRLADGAELTGADFTVVAARAAALPRGGVEVVIDLGLKGRPEARVTRTVAAFPGVAGFETRTEVAFPAVLTGYTLDEVALPGAAPTLHAFAAGYDWRGSDTPDWEPTVAPFGGAHTGDHRETTSRGPGEALEAEGEWLSLATPAGRRAFLVSQRVDYASTRMGYDGAVGRAGVDLRHDVVYLGPLEADAHVANPTAAPARQRVASPARPLALERTFLGFAVDADDEPWQHDRYLTRHRAPRWERAITFNSNGVDTNRISTGAKDDMDFAEVERQAAIARRLGVETFILDDGWQAISGDWCPDSPACPEPRRGTSPKFEPRFPDASFTAVREVLGDMRLGLWMSPMHFNPASDKVKRNPDWICQPVGGALTAYNVVEPNSSSNEAGLGTWNPLGLGPDGRLIDYIEGRIRHAVEAWDVRYFKFDFLTWIDCGGAQPVTMYEYREAFVDMLDRLVAAYPHVTFQIDETNDYRLFPFESVARGPSWYANGGPTANEALHNLWVLSPYVAPSTIGQAILGRSRGTLPTDYLMAVALLSHQTWFTDLTRLTDEQVAAAARWADLYRRHRERFDGLVYPLLDDPISGKTWTGLQPWDVDEQRGALLVFRQDTADASATVALRGIRGDGAYRVADAMTGAEVGTFAADELRSGIPITLDERHSAAVLLVDRV